MKIFLKFKFYLLVLFFSFVSTVNAQWDCDTGDCGGGIPPTPGGNTPGQGTGGQATPIDDYTIYLIGFAILIAITYFAVKKYKKSLI